MRPAFPTDVLSGRAPILFRPIKLRIDCVAVLSQSTRAFLPESVDHWLGPLVVQGRKLSFGPIKVNRDQRERESGNMLATFYEKRGPPTLRCEKHRTAGEN
jgi:hypothetical protein